MSATSARTTKKNRTETFKTPAAFLVMMPAFHVNLNVYIDRATDKDEAKRLALASIQNADFEWDIEEDSDYSEENAELWRTDHRLFEAGGLVRSLNDSSEVACVADETLKASNLLAETRRTIGLVVERMVRDSLNFQAHPSLTSLEGYKAELMRVWTTLQPYHKS